MTARDEASNVVTLRDIYDVGIQTQREVGVLTDKVNDLEKLPDRIGMLERSHAKIMGVAAGAAVVGGTATTFILWAVTRQPT